MRRAKETLPGVLLLSPKTATFHNRFSEKVIIFKNLVVN